MGVYAVVNPVTAETVKEYPTITVDEPHVAIARADETHGDFSASSSVADGTTRTTWRLRAHAHAAVASRSRRPDSNRGPLHYEERQPLHSEMRDYRAIHLSYADPYRVPPFGNSTRILSVVVAHLHPRG
jgi:hypothetical protein